MSYTREPMIQSCDPGQQVPYFDSYLLNIKFMPMVQSTPLIRTPKGP